MGERVIQRVVSAVVAVALLATGAASMVSPAAASDWWCWDDPVLVVENQVVQILAGVPEDARRSVRLASITVIVPAGVDARITASPSPKFPMSSSLIASGARAADGSVSITAMLHVDAAGAFQTALQMRQANGVMVTSYGVSNDVVRVTLQLQGKSNSGVRTAQNR